MEGPEGLSDSPSDPEGAERTNAGLLPDDVVVKPRN